MISLIVILDYNLFLFFFLIYLIYVYCACCCYWRMDVICIYHIIYIYIYLYILYACVYYVATTAACCLWLPADESRDKLTKWTHCLYDLYAHNKNNIYQMHALTHVHKLHALTYTHTYTNTLTCTDSALRVLSAYENLPEQAKYSGSVREWQAHA